MENALHLQHAYFNQVAFLNGIRYKHELLVKNLAVNIVAYPIFVVDVEDCRINWLNLHKALRLQALKHMAQHGCLYFIAVYDAIAFGSDQHVLHCKGIVVK